MFHVIVTSCYDHDLDRTFRSATEREGRGDAGDDVTGITARTAFASSSQHSRSLRATPVTGETADDLDYRERGVRGHPPSLLSNTPPPSSLTPPPPPHSPLFTPPVCFGLKSYFILQQLFVFLFDCTECCCVLLSGGHIWLTGRKTPSYLSNLQDDFKLPI